jgi:[ribosomal protein S5]-alanine N-acetyltransferase
MQSSIDPPDPPLRGYGFRLRPWRADDVEALLRIVTTSDIPRWTYLPHAMTEEQAASWIQRGREAATAGTGLPLAIQDTASSRVLGNVGLTNVRANLQTAEVFWWLEAPARGRGVAAAAVAVLAGWAFEQLGLARLAAFIEVGNAPSATLAERVGFQREGVLRSAEPSKDGRGRIDLEVWSLLPSDRSGSPASVGPDPAFSPSRG